MSFSCFPFASPDPLSVIRLHIKTEACAALAFPAAAEGFPRLRRERRLGPLPPGRIGGAFLRDDVDIRE